MRSPSPEPSRCFGFPSPAEPPSPPAERPNPFLLLPIHLRCGREDHQSALGGD